MSEAVDLLKSLAGVHAARVGALQGAASKATKPAAGATSDDFAALLEQARSGKIESGVPIRVPKHLGIELSESQAERLMKAADQAETQGAGRALVMMDGMGITIDVGTRTVTGVIDPSSPGVLEGIDAVVVASADPKAVQAKGDARSENKGVLAMPGVSPSLRPELMKALGRDGLDASAA
jgi:hypothetical protein